MFARKEKKEQRRELESQIAELETRLEKLKKHRQQRLNERGKAVEAYKQSVATKWEYLQVSDKDTKTWRSLDNLGSMGWELVGISNYTEKQTVFGTVEGTIYTTYVFKRKVVDVPDELLSEFADIRGIESELAQATLEIKGLQKELSSL